MKGLAEDELTRYLAEISPPGVEVQVLNAEFSLVELARYRTAIERLSLPWVLSSEIDVEKNRVVLTTSKNPPELARLREVLGPSEAVEIVVDPNIGYEPLAGS